MLRRSCVGSKGLISLGRCSTVPHSPPLGYRVAGLSASSLIIREKKGEKKISEIYMPAGTSTGLKYLFALLLAANVLPPRELDRCNYHVEEASKPTLRAAD
ncbi:hypothetical protein HBI83_015730 [Parastagonospora nodorum]|nr:hypothetical protein HBI83_015730 [Parastagonospora nodorum]